MEERISATAVRREGSAGVVSSTNVMERPVQLQEQLQENERGRNPYQRHKAIALAFLTVMNMYLENKDCVIISASHFLSSVPGKITLKT